MNKLEKKAATEKKAAATVTKEKMNTLSGVKEKPVSVYLPTEDKRRLKALSAATGVSASELIRLATRKYIETYKFTDEKQKLVYETLSQP